MFLSGILFVFLKAATENALACTVACFFYRISWNQALHMKHLKCSLNKHECTPCNELCLEMHEICTILIIFWEQMDLNIMLKTLIKKKCVTKIGSIQLIDV